MAWSRDPRILRKMAYFLLKGRGSEYTLSLLVIIIDNTGTRVRGYNNATCTFIFLGAIHKIHDTLRGRGGV